MFLVIACEFGVLLDLFSLIDFVSVLGVPVEFGFCGFLISDFEFWFTSGCCLISCFFLSLLFSTVFWIFSAGDLSGVVWIWV